MPTRDTNTANLPNEGARGRLGSQPQSVPMPRNFNADNDLAHPELVRNVDGRTLWDRNVATPFGDNAEMEPDGDEEVFDSGY